MSYYFTKLSPGVVMVHEEVTSYAITETQIKENVEYIRAHRDSYSDDKQYLARVNFYEQALETLSQGE